MSVSTARRTREIGGGGAGKIAAVASDKIISVYGKSVSTGKENSRPTSRIRAATQKPAIQPMARIDKLAAAAVEESCAEPRTRKSASSVPRGRNSSPAEVTRLFSESGKTSKVSGRPQWKSNISNSSEKTGKTINFERRVSKEFAKTGRISDVLEGFSLENKKVQIAIATSGAKEKKDGSFSSVLVKNPDIEENVRINSWSNARTLDHLGRNPQPKRISKFEDKEGNLSSIATKMSAFDDVSGTTNSNLSTERRASLEPKLRHSGVGVDGGLRLGEPKMANKASNPTKENGPSKHASKLHEKLAFLEGKVKRIASDIKRTKDMLDMNNPDSSKLILSDIQDKISGIEKAMIHVIENDDDANRGFGKATENEDKHDMDAIGAKGHVKGPNVEELEARLFPHHKLIRDRILLKSTLSDSNTILSAEDKVYSSNANAIASECLASLSEKETIGPEATEVQEMDDAVICANESSSLNVLSVKDNVDALLMSDENLNEFDDQENLPNMILEEEDEDHFKYQLNDIGSKSSTGGWFVSEGESVLLAHDDGSCSFYDIANGEEKTQYNPPSCISPNMWRDCWIIRAPGADGCSGKYVVAASAGNLGDSGFCSWDFYTKDIRAFHFEGEAARVRTALAPLSNNTTYRRNPLSSFVAVENRQWWYQPCGPLIASTGSCQKMVQVYDIRDSEQVMTWEVPKPVLAMDYSSPLHWRNRGKMVLAESDAISLWDVSSLNSQALLSVSSLRNISALHVNNTDAELGGGVRQRTTSHEAEGNDGVFCTSDSISVLDFRQPSGVGLKIPRVGVNMQSVFSCGDSIYVGCTNLTSSAKGQSSSQILHFSLRKQKLVSTYALPEPNAHHNFTSLTQVWGNSSYVMGVCGLGLFIFDSLKDDDPTHIVTDLVATQNVKEVIGPDNMHSPSFDYSSSRALIISRDRPASWRYLL